MTNPAERIAREFHETYEALAPRFGYDTRPESAKPWEDVPMPNRGLMIAVVWSLLVREVIDAGTVPEPAVDRPSASYEDLSQNDISSNKAGEIKECARFLVSEAKERGLTLTQLLDTFIREEQAFQDGWNEATEQSTPDEAECPECNGQGWTSEAGHAPECWNTGRCDQHGCPVQVQVRCHACGGEGSLPIADPQIFEATERTGVDLVADERPCDCPCHSGGEAAHVVPCCTPEVFGSGVSPASTPEASVCLVGWVGGVDHDHRCVGTHDHKKYHVCKCGATLHGVYLLPTDTEESDLAEALDILRLLMDNTGCDDGIGKDGKPYVHQYFYFNDSPENVTIYRRIEALLDKHEASDKTGAES
jgi:hypothetical protein